MAGHPPLQPGDLLRPPRLGLCLPGLLLSVQLHLRLLAADDLVRQPGQRARPGASRRPVTAAVTASGHGVLGRIGRPGLGEPRLHLSGQQRLQLADLDLQLPSGGVRRHRRIRLDLRPVPGHHIDADQALPRARCQRLDQQPLHRTLVPGHEPGHGGVIRVQALANHPGTHVIPGGHLDRPRGPDPLAIAVHDQAHHQPRMIGPLALPIGPVPGQERRQIHPSHRRAHRPGQMPRRQPLTRIGRQQPPLIPLPATSEVIPHNHIFPGQSQFRAANTPEPAATLDKPRSPVMRQPHPYEQNPTIMEIRAEGGVTGRR